MSRKKCSLGEQDSSRLNAHLLPSSAHFQDDFTHLHPQHNYAISNSYYANSHQQSHQNSRIPNNNQQRLRAHSAQPQQSNHKLNSSIGGTTEELEQIMALREELGRLHKPLFDGFMYSHKAPKAWREEQDEEAEKIIMGQPNQTNVCRFNQNEEVNINKWVDESLANELESSLHYQEDFHEKSYNQTEQIENWNDAGRNQKQHTFENIKQIIKRQQTEMKEYLEQRTTDTTDDPNISNNPNNKSSSEEALVGESKFKYDYSCVSGDQLQAAAQKAFQARELLSTSHDTTKLFDDEPPPPRHENHKGINNTFNFTHPLKIQPQQKYNFASAQKNPLFGCRQQKKKLSIVSDFKLEELLKDQIKDLQLCPKGRDHRADQVFHSLTQRDKRSQSSSNDVCQSANKNIINF